MRRRLAVGVVALGLLAAGCGAQHATKAGKATGPVVLRMATRDVDFTGDPAIGYFVQRVAKVSDGAVRVRVFPYWGHGAEDAEQQIVRAVSAGKVDLGAVGTRAFGLLGVTSL